jgi:hypothetical protein
MVRRSGTFLCWLAVFALVGCSTEGDDSVPDGTDEGVTEVDGGSDGDQDLPEGSVDTPPDAETDVSEEDGSACGEMPPETCPVECPADYAHCTEYPTPPGCYGICGAGACCVCEPSGDGGGHWQRIAIDCPREDVPDDVEQDEASVDDGGAEFDVRDWGAPLE